MIRDKKIIKEVSEAGLNFCSSMLIYMNIMADYQRINEFFLSFFDTIT